ncbi:hypothetical protein [Nocardioides pantholopis]|uniref:hypothetical protein n=1 Tax=Nocardioides pantholopis TaxID=2483798 RepID=UPI000F096A8F|nr:hypothetical protein [Nocardioides pantholopis]
MADPGDYCELCDLPFSQCVHGRPEPVPAERPAPAPRVKAPPRVPGTRASAPAPAPTRARRWTAPEELRPAILATLQEAGGELAGDDVFERLEERIGDLLRPGDRDPNPQGELRWRAAARKARKALMDDGLLAAAGPGVWRLTDAGRTADPTPEA